MCLTGPRRSGAASALAQSSFPHLRFLLCTQPPRCAGREEFQPWLKPHVHTPAAMDPPPRPWRRRPLIYIYGQSVGVLLHTANLSVQHVQRLALWPAAKAMWPTGQPSLPIFPLACLAHEACPSPCTHQAPSPLLPAELPPMYNSHMLQYRIEKGNCVHRWFASGNTCEWAPPPLSRRSCSPPRPCPHTSGGQNTPCPAAGVGWGGLGWGGDASAEQKRERKKAAAGCGVWQPSNKPSCPLPPLCAS